MQTFEFQCNLFHVLRFRNSSDRVVLTRVNLPNVTVAYIPFYIEAGRHH